MRPLLDVIRRLLTVRVPPDSRVAFARDLPALAGRAVFFVILGSLAAQLVQVLGGSRGHVAALRAAPHLGLLLSLAWVAFGRGRSPLRMIFWPELISRIALVALAFTAGLRDDLVATVFTIVVGTSHAIVAVTVPFITTLYGIVYPAACRARIVAYGRMLHGVAGIASAWGLGTLFQVDPAAHRWVYPALGLLGLGLTWSFCTMPVDAARERAPRVAASAWTVLREDRMFRRFQGFQFLLGFANLGAIPVVDVYVREELGLPIGFAVLIVAQGVIGQACTLLTVRAQGALFDRIGVVWHRTLTSSLLGIAFIIWAFADRFELGVAAALLTGLGMAGGQIIWIIGSLSFAPPERFSTYNGIHTFLTGLRGVSAPLVGVALLRSPWLDGNYRLFFLGTAGLIFVSVIGHALFVRLPRRDEKPKVE